MAKQNQRPSAAMVKAGSAELEFDEQTGEEIVRHGMTAMTMRTEIVTAQRIAVPRVLNKVKENVVREAELTGGDFEYRWTVKGNQVIEGVSVDGAMILLRNFGNCDCDVQIIQDAPNFWILSARFVDYETGFSLRRAFRQRKGEKHGNFDEDRALDIAFQIGQSKAQRNVIIKSMPVWLVSAAVDAARKGAEAGIADVPKSAAEAVAGFGKLTVTQAQLEAKIGAPIATWGKRDIVFLRTVFKAIKDRETTVANEFPPIAAVPETPAQLPATDAPAAAPSSPATTAPATEPAAPAAVPPEPEKGFE